MGPSRQQAEHLFRVVVIEGFSKHHVVNDDRRISGEHKAFSFTCGDRTRLRCGDATDIGVRQFTWMDRFIDVRVYHIEVDASTAQQFRASWRSRAQDDSLHPLIFTCDRIAGP